MNIRATRQFLLFVLLFGIGLTALAQTAQSPFRLQNGDRVAFYGDSITEQRLYTRDIEIYTLTRFPDRRITFVMSGVGGDRVSGGWAGPIDLRLRRDVFDYKPSVVTIMLGMNDGYYRPYDPAIMETYSEEYRHIVQSLQQNLPNSRLLLIKPSAYDNVTRPFLGEPYNDVMIKMGDFLQQLSAEAHTDIADMNSPMVKTLQTAAKQDPALAATLILDRIHPSAAVHWVMADAVLKAWQAPAIVTKVELDGKSGKANTTNTDLSDFKRTKAGLSWTQMDKALPLPFAPVNADPIFELAMASSEVIADLDQEVLEVANLEPGDYRLLIDGQTVGQFSSEQLGRGINLARLETPMMQQARVVATFVDVRNSLEAARFNFVHDKMSPEAAASAEKLATLITANHEQAQKAAAPVAHQYSLLPLKPGK